MAKLEKSEIVSQQFKKVEIKPIQNQIKKPKLPELKLSNIEKLQIKANNLKDKSKHLKNFIKYYLLIYKETKMETSPITTKLGNKAFWVQLIGWIIALLGLLGVQTEVLTGLAEQIATALASISAIVIGLWFNKKTAEETQDKNGI
jgi:uncharacterized membrane protein